MCGLGLNITVQSYCGSLDFGIAAHRGAGPRAGRALHGARGLQRWDAFRRARGT
jgi:hypothetical protein